MKYEIKSKAPTELLNLLHGLIAHDMRRKLEQGLCEAKDWAVIVKFLKDNGIDCVIDDTMSNVDAFNQLVAAGQKSIEEQMSLH